MSGVIDLAEIKRRAELEAEARKQAEDEATLARAVRWDRAMTRAFKGILPAPERRASLRRAARRMERNQ